MCEVYLQLHICSFLSRLCPSSDSVVCTVRRTHAARAVCAVSHPDRQTHKLAIEKLNEHPPARPAGAAGTAAVLRVRTPKDECTNTTYQ